MSSGNISDKLKGGGLSSIGNIMMVFAFGGAICVKRKVFYANDNSITSLKNRLKKTKSKLGTLELNVSSGADQETLNEIDKLDKGFKAAYKVFVYTL